MSHPRKLRRLTTCAVWALANLIAAGCDPGEAGPLAPVADQAPVSGDCNPTQSHSDPFGDCLDSLTPGPGAAFGHDALPQIVLGPPVPAAGGGGTTHVASLGCGGSITVMFDGEGLLDRPGDDLIVFENPFGTGDSTFAEPARVLVSSNGVDWYGWPCRVAGDGNGDEAPPNGCAGLTPTTVDSEAPFEPGTAGGDAFDLSELGLSAARWVRLLDRTEAHYGDARWCAGASGGFDLDAVAAAVPWPDAQRLHTPQDPGR